MFNLPPPRHISTLPHSCRASGHGDGSQRDNTNDTSGRGLDARDARPVRAMYEIAERLIEMTDRRELRKVAKFINDHLRHPHRDPLERAIALGRVSIDSLNGTLNKKAALQVYRKAPPEHSWRVEAVTKDGKRWRNGVCLSGGVRGGACAP
jgi:hypothetical protein